MSALSQSRLHALLVSDHRETSAFTFLVLPLPARQLLPLIRPSGAGERNNADLMWINDVRWSYVEDVAA
jgi:hypothetical protein